MEWYAILGLAVQSAIWLVVFFILGIWVFLSLAEWCCCFRPRLRLPWASAGAAARGLKPPEIERYPKFSYPKVGESAADKMSRGITECAVCLAAFKEAETLRLIPVCGHVFHADCVDTWLRSNTTCPCCRANLQLQPPPPEATNQLPV